MMAPDPLNNLDKWPLDNIDQFIDACNEKGVKEIYITGSNTDPLLYKHTPEMLQYLSEKVPGCKFGVRSNGAEALSKIDTLNLYQQASLHITTFDPTFTSLQWAKENPQI